MRPEIVMNLGGKLLVQWVELAPAQTSTSTGEIAVATLIGQIIF